MHSLSQIGYSNALINNTLDKYNPSLWHEPFYNFSFRAILIYYLFRAMCQMKSQKVKVSKYLVALLTLAALYTGFKIIHSDRNNVRIYRSECIHPEINPSQSIINHRWPKSKGNVSTLFTNFILINGDGEESKGLEILVENGLISQISTKINGDFDNVLDLDGRYLSPGLVDMHSHLGTDSWPEFEGTSDTNEMSSNPVLPQLRSIDGINPDDLALKIVNRVKYIILIVGGSDYGFGSSGIC